MERGLGHIDFSLADAAATRALGARLAAVCPPGSLVLLRGPLGAGKTTLVEGVVEAIGAGHAASPTFVLVHAYLGGSMPVSHVDMYRLEDPRDVEDLDIGKYVRADGITVVEWPERAADAWAADRVEIDIALDGDGRRAHVEGFGSLAHVVAQLALGPEVRG